MPVYECYCPDCHTVFSFFSRRVDTGTRPDCPRCGRSRLSRQASLFAIGKRRAAPEEGAADSPLPPGVDETRVMRAFESMAGELEGLDDSDPRQAARALRRLYESAGLPLGEGMGEAIRRMEAGEDPDAIDAGLGDPMDWEDPLAALGAGAGASEAMRRLRRGVLPPARDDRWYPLRPAEGEAAPGTG